ncbi:FAD/NAD-P-binding domain-containing protein [Lactarius akahatsu]|uniref:FAD/NAD-P-binding domain-containing protein n=1 Tax=Lactarius akahatsu TaxID=416441 RepID=A0AAD4LUM2_9AGAM|nr:FAD/NAD-P-binding domain-containing protein [Lactarius akahatsu]
MPNWFRLALSLLQFQAPLHLSRVSLTADVPDKRIAIVGGGTAGIVMLKTLVDDLPKDLTQTWEIVLFEQRDDVGGIWYPDPHTPHPPDLPESPLYPRLRTNTPHPSMTIPQFQFPPGTALFPNHAFVHQYHKSMISRWNLSSYIHLRHEVLAADWHGDNVSGHWQLTALDRTHNRTVHAGFDHLVVASGHNQYPYEPKFQGQQVWEASAPGRKVLHSIFYREPEVYRGRNVLVVGGGASGRDISQQVVRFANSTYVSLRSDSMRLLPLPFPHIPGVERVGAISHFTPHAPVFEDGTSLPQIDTVLLATGYELRVPFLSFIRNTSLSTPLPDPHDCDALTNNGRYLRPLFRHVLSLAPTHAPLALAFIGLPIFVSNGISDFAQALLVAHALADPALLPPASALLADLRAQEAALDNPARIGHRIVQPGGGTAYQDELVAILQDSGREGGGIPSRGTRFTEPWREFATRESGRLRLAWLKIEALGKDEVRKWLGSVKRGDEAEWVDLMERLAEWFKEQMWSSGTRRLIGAPT